MFESSTAFIKATQIKRDEFDSQSLTETEIMNMKPNEPCDIKLVFAKNQTVIVLILTEKAEHF